ncbi:uncharacterized protein LOC143297670 [Babylonia areolata]|uniref:uncharacterized protein LOC143297670 n=1 Tax=Babylonia areolata TaxID=304850 RepID=UPI003FD3F3D7
MQASHTAAPNTTTTTTTTTTAEVTTALPITTEGHFKPWDNPDNIISLETYLTISFVSNSFLYPGLFLVGVPTNAVNCVVFWRQGLGDRMHLCLFCLALVDMSYLIVLMVQAASVFISLADKVLGAEYYAKSLVYCLGVGWGFKAASGLISTVIAVERCLCVVRPLHVESIMRTRTMLWLLVVIVLGTQLAQVIQPLAYTARRVVDLATGEVFWNIVTTRLYADNRVILDFVLVVLLPFIIPVFSFIVVSLSTAVTAVRLRTAQQWREESSVATTTGVQQLHHHQAALTLVLVLLSCVYVTCTAPLVAVTLARLLVPGFSPEGRYSNICIASHQLGTVFSAVNSAVNFFVYFWRSSHFRKTMRGLCGRHQCQNAKLASMFSIRH